MRRCGEMFLMVLVAVLVFSIPAAAGAFDHFEIGMRAESSQVVHDDKSARFNRGEGFLGSVNNLEARTSMPELFAGYRLNPNLGLELALGQLRVGANSVYPESVSTDGDFLFKQIRLAAVGRLPRKYGALYAGGGALYNSGEFDADPFWANGNGKHREMYVRDSLGITAFAGGDIRIWGNLFVDIRISYEEFTSRISFAGFIGEDEVYRKGPFPLRFDNWGVSFGVKLAL